MRLWGLTSGSSGGLPLGQECRLQTSGAVGIVGHKLGSGGQGAVYLCDVGGRQLALKWYHAEVIERDGQLRQRIERLTAEEPPDKRFLFPIDLVSIAGRKEFGYVMPVVSPDRRQIDGILGIGPTPFTLSLEARAAACYEIAESFQALHMRGLCYQDINFGAFFIDPIRGGILICDTDNITSEDKQGGVHGSPKFMAPELVRHDPGVIPRSGTDLFSMAVLFFYTLFQWHPLDGKRHAALRERTRETDLRLYGEDPLFIFDPTNDANGPVAGRDDWVKARWEAMPAMLRELFVRSFTVGLFNPSQRVVEIEWRNAMARLRDAIALCPGCDFEIPLDAATDSAGRPICTACKEPVPRPTRMSLRRYLVSMQPTRMLLAHHVDGAAPLTLSNSIGTVDAHPTDKTQTGLRNLTQSTWTGRVGDGRLVPVVPGGTVRIVDGLGIDFGPRQGQISGADAAGPSVP